MRVAFREFTRWDSTFAVLIQYKSQISIYKRMRNLQMFHFKGICYKRNGVSSYLKSKLCPREKSIAGDSSILFKNADSFDLLKSVRNVHCCGDFHFAKLDGINWIHHKKSKFS